MKVVLVRPFVKGAYGEAFGFTPPPLGLASLAGSIRDLASVFIVDAEAMGLNSEFTADVIEDIDPDLVGFTTISSTYYGPSKELMGVLRGRGVDGYSLSVVTTPRSHTLLPLRTGLTRLFWARVR